MVRTMQAPARITSARLGWSPTIAARLSSGVVRYCSIYRSISSRVSTVPWILSGSYFAIA